MCEVFTHPITKVWDHDLAWKVVDVVGAHTVSYKIPSFRRVYWNPQIRFITIDVVRFKDVDEAPEDEDQDEDEDKETVEAKKPVVGPVTIWIGVFPESTSAIAAHDAAHGLPD